MMHPTLIDAMMQPDFYPHKTGRIELLQTHISYIFIAGEFVYKIKKPFNLGFLDFTTLERRRHYCEEELRLNRRLAPDFYLDVLAIYENRDGRFSLAAGDQIIEYAVRMKKLPHDRMLKELMRDGKVSLEVMKAIAGEIAVFHEKAETGGEIDEIGSIDTIRKNHLENFTETAPFVHITLPEYQYRFIKAYALDFMERNKFLFHQRVADHRIRNCHGDLHLEHICVLDSGIVIFDCIEFEKRFRYNDVAAEVAFLAMDLEFNGYEEYGKTFIDAYTQASQDTEIRMLLNFYKCYYAYVRGKVSSLKFANSKMDLEEERKTKEAAIQYFDLAYTYAARLEKPTLMLMSGLMGTGKSKLSKLIAPRLGAHIIQMDAIRKEILNLSPTDRHFEAFGEGIYAHEMTKLTYEKALNLASRKLEQGIPVIIDASFKSRKERAKANALALKNGWDFLIIECLCREDIIRQRLEARIDDDGEASDGRWELFQSQKESFEPITESPEQAHIAVDTSAGLKQCDQNIISFVYDIFKRP